jgi:hypothetical protein
MSDHEATDDPVVRTALQLLPVPDHTTGFWQELDHALAAEGPSPVTAAPTAASTQVAAREVPPTRAVAAVPTPAGRPDPTGDPDAGDPALALVPATLRRPSNAVLLVVAAAAVVVVAPGSVPSDLDALVRESQPQDSTPVTLAAGVEQAASGAVLDWIDALAAGDSGDAWSALGPESQAHFGTQTAFEAQAPDLVVGYAAWSAGPPEHVFITPVATDDAGSLAVVTLVGSIDLPSGPERRADAFPVRIEGDEIHLEPFALLGGLELVTPEAPAGETTAAPVSTGDELLVVVPAGADAPVLHLDDGAPVVCGKSDGSELTTMDATPAQRCAWTPPGGHDPRAHTHTVAFLGSDGSSMGARSVLFDAA